tara:strand:+ start:88 stop:699 length:612 start_codon:yes stop_codon:yes gene_type:complete
MRYLMLWVCLASLSATALAAEAEKTLSAVIKAGDMQALSQLTAEGADVNARDAEGYTPLASAVLHGEPQAALLLLSLGAEVDTREPEGWTPLYLAYLQDKVEMANLLHKAGAEVNIREENGDLLAFRAMERLDNPAMAQVMIDHGLNVLKRDAEDRTLFDVATLHNHPKVAKTLAEHYVALLKDYQQKLQEEQRKQAEAAATE